MKSRRPFVDPLCATSAQLDDAGALSLEFTAAARHAATAGECGQASRDAFFAGAFARLASAAAADAPTDFAAGLADQWLAGWSTVAAGLADRARVQATLHAHYSDPERNREP